MALLIIFGFIAGAATAVSPCVLPVLPIALSAGATGGRRRPLGVVSGLALSFTFATVALVYVIDALGLPNELLRKLAIAVLLVFGVILLLPPVAARVEAYASRLTSRFGAQNRGDGFWSGILLGLSLGLLYAPCAGPILAGVITVSASQSFNAGRVAVALAYGLGSAVVLYALMIGGRRLVAPLARRGGALQMATGAIMVVVALAMFGHYDTKFESSIASSWPSWLTTPAEGLENTGSAQVALTEIRGTTAHGIGAEAASGGAGSGKESPPAKAPHGGGGGNGGGGSAAKEEAETKLTANEETVPLEEYGKAPEFTGTEDWFNTPGDKPLTLKGLRGRVVLVDFWTYSCINCIRTLPYLEAWDKRYRKDGLTIVGVHTPEFPFEREASNVEEAIQTEGIKYPVVQDNEEGTWNAYGNQYWPAEYFIDAKGNVRYVHFGEGEYGEKEQVIRELLKEAGDAPGKGGADAHGMQAEPGVSTPETYLGTKRHERFTNGDFEAGANEFGPIEGEPGPSMYTFGGGWNVAEENATAEAGAKLDLNFGARRVYLVLGSPGHPRKMKVLLDGVPISEADAGKDVHGGVATITDQRLYDLVELPKVEEHVLELVPEAGIQGYAFTFG